MKPKALVLFSGGQDSTTCLYWAIAQGWDVHTLSINYGQRHHRELAAAMIVASMAGIESSKFEVLNVGKILNGTSPLVSDAKLEQYPDHNSLPGGLEKTFVPMRNQLFLTLAANRAACIGAQILVTGVCEEDYGGYPDCRKIFISAIERAINYGTFGADAENERDWMHIHTPLMRLSKADTVHLALQFEGCYKALAYSHTAYDGAYPPVGSDHATLLREKGFLQANVPDPLVLRAVNEGKMVMPALPNYHCSDLKEYMKLAGLEM